MQVLHTLLKIFAVSLILLPQEADAQSTQAPAPQNPNAADLSSRGAQRLHRLIEEERALLTSLGLSPITVSGGQQVGDVYHPQTGILIAAPTDCFPNLSPIRTPAQLPSVTFSSDQALGATLGVAGVAEGRGAGNRRDRFELLFRDVETVRASMLQLRRSLTADPNCQPLKPFFEAIPFTGNVVIASAPRPAPIVIGAVYHARRVIRVTTDQRLEGEAKLSWANDFLRRMGLSGLFNIEGTGSTGQSSTVELVGESVIPVAYSAVFIESQVRITINSPAPPPNRVEPGGISIHVPPTIQSTQTNPDLRVTLLEPLNDPDHPATVGLAQQAFNSLSSRQYIGYPNFFDPKLNLRGRFSNNPSPQWLLQPQPQTFDLVPYVPFEQPIAPPR
ncbi:hypothetical protein [Falsiroseomonas sp. E2-1-a20]|uniref:hypothetical protein n=1 Tax=Falsiroseomonas sp. E2-1-a20 TaxID=3239300 RepID=UPI003F3B68C7